MKQLTRQQLQNDLDAARKHRAMAEEAYTNEFKLRALVEREIRNLNTTLAMALEERDEWRAVFKTISKLVK